MSLSASGRTWDDAAAPAAIRLARRFEAEWRDAPAAGRRPELGRFLDEAGTLPGARLALLRADMTMRWEAGEKADAAWYRARYPGLDAETLVALIYEEFCLREEDQENPDPETYFERYPEVCSQLRRVLDIHGLVGSGQTSVFRRSDEPEASFPDAGETIAGFRLVEELGRGAFARVFLAEERQLADRPVALKVSRTGTREPQTLARLQHTHIVPVYSYRTDASTNLHLLCMPYFGRVTLSRVLAGTNVKTARTGAVLLDALDRLGNDEAAPATAASTTHGRSPARVALTKRTFPEAVAWWGARMAEALDHAHSRGVLHRDVKPSNVLITDDGMPMLLDFNLAREVLLEVEGEKSLPGGTLDYMSPEHLEELADGQSDRVGLRSDVYGLGVLLFECLMGTRPFAPPKGASSATQLLLRAADDRRAGPPRIRTARPDIPPPFEAVIRRSLAPDPLDRYATAAELATDLQAVADDRPLRYAREPVAYRVRRWTRRNRRRIAAVLPIVTALAVILGLLLFVRRTAENRMDQYRAQWVRTRVAYDEGLRLDEKGDFDQAIPAYTLAERLADYPDPGGSTRFWFLRGAPEPSPVSLAELREWSHHRLHNVLLTKSAHETARKFTDEAGPLRFRLIGFGSDLASATDDVLKALAPYHVFDKIEGAKSWTSYPDLSLLEPARRDALLAEVNQVLFHWAVALEKDGKPDAQALAKGVCDKAIGFAKSPGPWLALRARVTRTRAPAPDTVGDPSDLVCFQWGVLRLLEGKTTEALTWLQKAAGADPGNYWYQYYLGYVYDLQPGRSDMAFRHYAIALSHEPNTKTPWVRFSLARLYRRHNVWSEARKGLERAIALYRGLTDKARYPGFERMARLELGLVRQSLGDMAEARREYEWVTTSDPASPEAYAARLNLAKLEAEAGDPNVALADYETLVHANPNTPDPRFARAQLLVRLWRLPEAVDELTALLLCPEAERREVLARRAQALLLAGRAREALTDVETAILLRGGLREERLRARCLIALGRVEELTLSRPEEFDTLPENGLPLREDLLRAANRLGQPLPKKPTDGVQLNLRLTRALILCAAAGGHTREALDDATRAVQLAPLSPRPYLLRARILRQLKEASLARHDVDWALYLEPESPVALELRGVLKTEAGDAVGGLADLDRSILIADRVSAHAARAATEVALNKPLAAIADWTRVLQSDPTDAAAFLARANAFLALKLYDQASADLEQAATWFEGKPTLGFRLAMTYVACLGRRPDLLPHLVALTGRMFRAMSATSRPVAPRPKPRRVRVT